MLPKGKYFYQNQNQLYLPSVVTYKKNLTSVGANSLYVQQIYCTCSSTVYIQWAKSTMDAYCTVKTAIYIEAHINIIYKQYTKKYI